MSVRNVCFPFAGDTVGGSHIGMLPLIKGLDRRRYEPLIVVHEEGACVDLLQKNAVPYHVLPLTRYAGVAGQRSLRNIINAGLVAPGLAKFVRREGIEIVHTSDKRMHLTWGPATRMARAHFVYHQKSTYHPSRAERIVMGLSDRIVSMGSNISGWLPKQFVDKTIEIADPFETDLPTDRRTMARRELAKATDTGESRRFIGYFNNFIDRKRPHLFLETAALVCKQTTDSVHFAMFGDDRIGCRSELESAVSKLGLEGRFHFMGFRTPVDHWMAACDIILAPAVDEPFGRTLVEAMLLETLVIAAASGGHIDIVEDGKNGILVPADDAGAMASACLDVLNDQKTFDHIIGYARRNAATKYSAAHHVEQVIAMYDTIISG